MKYFISYIDSHPSFRDISVVRLEEGGYTPLVVGANMRYRIPIQMIFILMLLPQ
jgi:hypothetical protein